MTKYYIQNDKGHYLKQCYTFVIDKHYERAYIVKIIRNNHIAEFTPKIKDAKEFESKSQASIYYHKHKLVLLNCTLTAITTNVEFNKVTIKDAEDAYHEHLDNDNFIFFHKPFK